MALLVVLAAPPLAADDHAPALDPIITCAACLKQPIATLHHSQQTSPVVHVRLVHSDATKTFIHIVLRLRC